MSTFNWECPYCGRHQAVGSSRFSRDDRRICNDDSELGPTVGRIVSVVCSNDDCKKMTLKFQLCIREDTDSYGHFETKELINDWDLMPESSAKPLPSYIPQPLIEDYTQACRIRDLSPKASATLARRCLQGMIRDFCNINRKRLIDEINELRSQINDGKAPPGVQADTIDAIDHVRSLGNIGAHMEADINMIVDIDPDEAQTLIGLLELLFDEWYVARHTRQERLKAIGVVAADKAAKKKGS